MSLYRNIALACIAVVLTILGFAAGQGLERVQQKRVDAVVFADLASAKATLDSANALIARQTAEIDSLKALTQGTKIVYRDRVDSIPVPTPLPAVCDACVKRGDALMAALEAADSVIVGQDRTIEAYTTLIASLSDSLRTLPRVIERVADLVPVTSGKSGLLPKPYLVVGVGANLKTLEFGPQVTLGLRMAL